MTIMCATLTIPGGPGAGQPTLDHFPACWEEEELQHSLPLGHGGHYLYEDTGPKSSRYSVNLYSGGLFLIIYFFQFTIFLFPTFFISYFFSYFFSTFFISYFFRLPTYSNFLLFLICYFFWFPTGLVWSGLVRSCLVWSGTILSGLVWSV